MMNTVTTRTRWGSIRLAVVPLSPSEALNPENRGGPLPRIYTIPTIHLAFFFSYRILIT